MAMNNGKADYNDLQRCLDKVVGKLGLQKTIRLLDSFIDNAAITLPENSRFRLLTEYVISCAIKVFDLKAEEFFTSRKLEYREARMVCYSLIKKYTDSTYPKIAELFGQNERRVLYFTVKVQDRLSLPEYYREFIIRHDAVERKVIEFIGKLN